MPCLCSPGRQAASPRLLLVWEAPFPAALTLPFLSPSCLSPGDKGRLRNPAWAIWGVVPPPPGPATSLALPSAAAGPPVDWAPWGRAVQSAWVAPSGAQRWSGLSRARSPPGSLPCSHVFLVVVGGCIFVIRQTLPDDLFCEPHDAAVTFRMPASGPHGSVLFVANAANTRQSPAFLGLIKTAAQGIMRSRSSL